MTTPRPQDTDPLRATGTDREHPTADEIMAMSAAEFSDHLERTGMAADVRAALARYPGWSSPPGPLSRLVAWVRKWRRG